MKKHPYLLLFFATLLLWLSSCNNTIICRTEKTIRYFNIPDYDSAQMTVLRVVRYEGGSNYTSVLDSTDNPINSPSNITHPFEENKEYKLVLLPQKRVHTLKNVHYGDEKRKGSPGRDSEQCHTSITYTYDGKTVTQPYYVSSGGYLKVDL